jgi:hypothetical protein
MYETARASNALEDSMELLVPKPLTNTKRPAQDLVNYHSHLYEAVVKNNVADARRLLSHGVNVHNAYGSLLHVAARMYKWNNHATLAMVELLLAQPTLDLDRRDELGDTALMTLVPWASTRLEPIMDRLVKAGVDVNATNDLGETILHKLVKSHYGATCLMETSRRIIQHGAGPSLFCKDKDGYRPDQCRPDFSSLSVFFRHQRDRYLLDLRALVDSVLFVYDVCTIVLEYAVGSLAFDQDANQH